MKRIENVIVTDTRGEVREVHSFDMDSHTIEDVYEAFENMMKTYFLAFEKLSANDVGRMKLNRVAQGGERIVSIVKSNS